MYRIEKTITKTSSKGKVYTVTRTFVVQDEAEWRNKFARRRRRKTYRDEFADLYASYLEDRAEREFERRQWDDRSFYEMDPMDEIGDIYDEYVRNDRDFRY